MFASPNMEESVHIPRTAIRVKVTNVIDPYHIRIYQVDGYAEKLIRLEGKLQKLAKHKLSEYGAEVGEPRMGDMVMIYNAGSSNVDLPAWWCRGVVGPKSAANLKYAVFLPDHGVGLHFWAEELKILPPSTICDDFLTEAIGMYDLLPITLETGLVCISEHWIKTAVQFTRDIISASSQVYFDHVASDKSGNKFGELYLVLEGEIVTLSEALVCNEFATVISDCLMDMIEDNDTSVQVGPTISAAKHTNLDMNHDRSIDAEEVTKKYSESLDGDKCRDRSTAVYSRAFSRSLKAQQHTKYDNEILVYSKNPCEQISWVSEARFPPKIHKTLRSVPFTRPMRLQAYVWPAIMKGFNVVAVNYAKSGRTMSYLIPIISLVAENEIYPKVATSNGPLALILCMSSCEVHDVYSKCVDLLKEYRHIKVLAAYNGIPEKSLVVNIYNGCEIFICMPPYLARLIKNNKNLLNFKRLTHMVFDGADMIFEKYHMSLREILKIPKAVKSERQKSPGTMPLQIITIARHWTCLLRRVVDKLIENPYICIGSYVEAAVWAAIKPKLIFLPKNQKAEKVAELLNTQSSMFKTVIVCTTTTEARDLEKFLKSKSIDTLIAHADMTFIDIRGVKEDWLARVAGKYSVLVCTDQVLSDINITDAQWLIHFSLASSTKSQFFYRFSMLTANFFPHTDDKKSRQRHARIILMADETNDTQLNGVVTMMRRLEAIIPPAMETYLEKIFLSAEMAKSERSLCENVKAFGQCSRKDSCASRHCILSDVDRPATPITTGDTVKMLITYIHGANHYSARIIEYTVSVTNERVPFSFKEFIELSAKLQNHFADPACRRSCKLVKVGNVCAIEEAPGNFKRVQVLSVVNKDSSEIPNTVIRCIDDGDVLSVKGCQLLELPDYLAQWPSHIVDVYLAGIIPYDDEPTWSPCADNIVCNWFTEKLSDPDSYVFGKVLLHLGHILWIDPLEVRHKLENGYPDLIDSSLKTTLIEAKCGTNNEQHVLNLRKLCSMTS